MDSWRQMKTSPSWDESRFPPVVRRPYGLAKQHLPFVAFLTFALLIFICTQLPWASSNESWMSRTPYRPQPSSLLTANGSMTEYIPKPETNVTFSKPKVAKVAVASGFEDAAYEGGLETHRRHAEMHGYPLYLTREGAVDGMFNKIAFVMRVLLEELYKAPEERVEWLFYFDSDSIIMNENIPLEIFFPPSDYEDVNFIAAKDWNGLNAGVFLLRVSPWSLSLLDRTMSYKHYHPDADYTFEEQSIIALLTEGDDEFKDQSIYVPRSWFNAYFSDINEVRPGLLLSHFPHPDYKWHMFEWLRVLEADRDHANKPHYTIPLAETEYPAQIRGYWATRRRVRSALKAFDRNINRGADPIEFGLIHEETKGSAKEFREKLTLLRRQERFGADDPKQNNELVAECEKLSAKLISELMSYFETHDDPPPVAGF